MTTFYIVRHGQTEWNVEKRLQGHKDSALTELGISQANQIRMELADIKFDQVFSSDSLRAKRTAEIISLEKKIAVQTTQLIREGSFGKYEGKLVEEYLEELKENLLEIDKLTAEEKFKKRVHEDVESGEEMATRFITFLREIAVGFENQTILIVSHGAIMRMLLVKLGLGTLDEIGPHTVKNCACVVVESDGVDFFIKETKGIEIESH